MSEQNEVFNNAISDNEIEVSQAFERTIEPNQNIEDNHDLPITAEITIRKGLGR